MPGRDCSRRHFADNAVYLQDGWRPTSRLTINAGVRVDRVTRDDDLFTLRLQDSWEIGPRAGVNFVLTKDQRNVVRGSFMRVHEAVNINAQSASGAGTQGSGAQTIGYRDLYDTILDGTFRAVFGMKNRRKPRSRILRRQRHLRKIEMDILAESDYEDSLSMLGHEGFRINDSRRYPVPEDLNKRFLDARESSALIVASQILHVLQDERCGSTVSNNVSDVKEQVPLL